MSIKRADPPIYFTAAEEIYTFCPEDRPSEPVICPRCSWYRKTNIMETWYRFCGHHTDTSLVFGIMSKTNYIRIVLFTLSTLRLLVLKNFSPQQMNTFILHLLHAVSPRVTSASRCDLHLFSALIAPLVAAAQMWEDRPTVKEGGERLCPERRGLIHNTETPAHQSPQIHACQQEATGYVPVHPDTCHFKRDQHRLVSKVLLWLDYCLCNEEVKHLADSSGCFWTAVTLRAMTVPA